MPVIIRDVGETKGIVSQSLLVRNVCKIREHGASAYQTQVEWQSGGQLGPPVHCRCTLWNRCYFADGLVSFAKLHRRLQVKLQLQQRLYGQMWIHRGGPGRAEAAADSVE
jgi:hypothetical protein